MLIACQGVIGSVQRERVGRLEN